VIEGVGKATYPGGDTYEGAFVAGKREGQGKLTYKAGQVSDGVWKNGMLTAPTPAAPAEGTVTPPADGTAPATPDPSGG